MVKNPLDPTNTARVYIDYTSAALQHTLIIRMGLGATAGEASVLAASAADVLRTRMSMTDSFLAARFSDKASHISLPIAFTPIAGALDLQGGAAAWAEDPESAFLCLVGRGQTSGRRVRWEFFTTIRTPLWPTTNRYNLGASPVIDTFRLNWANLVESGAISATQIVTIAGDRPIVYGYVNIAKNSYWQRKQR